MDEQKENIIMDTLLKFTQLQQALYDYQQAVRINYTDEIIMDGHLATQQLINQIKTPEIEINGYHYEVTIELLPYWKFVERGVNGTDNDQGSPYSFHPDKEMIPQDVVLKWLKVKQILPKPNKDGKLPTMKSLAWVIAHSIHEKGIEAGNELKKTLQEMNADWTVRISEAVTKDLSESVGLLLNDNMDKAPVVIKL